MTELEQRYLKNIENIKKAILLTQKSINIARNKQDRELDKLKKLHNELAMNYIELEKLVLKRIKNIQK